MGEPQTENLLELIYAIKLLAKTAEDIGENVEKLLEGDNKRSEALQANREMLQSLTQELKTLPLVLAQKTDELIDKRVNDAFEEFRGNLNEIRNKLWALKKQVKDSTGSHQLPVAGTIGGTGSHPVLPESEEGIKVGLMNRGREVFGFKPGQVWTFVKLALATLGAGGGILAAIKTLLELHITRGP